MTRAYDEVSPPHWAEGDEQSATANENLAGVAEYLNLADDGLQPADSRPMGQPIDQSGVQVSVEGHADSTPYQTAGSDTHAGKVTIDDFHAYMPAHRYIFTPTGELWPAASVNARCEMPAAEPEEPSASLNTDDDAPRPPKSPSAWIDKYRPVDQLTWAPGQDKLIPNKLVMNGGWVEHPGCTVFNLYQPPTIRHGSPAEAAPWIAHVRRLYPTDADHIIEWLAHRVQRPGDKVNHALLLGGAMGIGKDTLLEPIKHAIGPWNFNEVSPSHLLGRFNGFVKSVILRISEARDLGDIDRFAFYDHIKTYTASPPDVLRCDEKNIKEHSVSNVCGVIITSNHKTDGIYLPADDRRNYVAWSDLTRDDFEEGHWNNLYGWLEKGGHSHVAAYLARLDISNFDAKKPPPKTPAFHEIVDSNRAPEDAELADAIDALGNPQALTLTHLRIHGCDSLVHLIEDRRGRRQLPHRLDVAGYTPVRNPTAKDGLWVIGGRRQAVYVQRSLALRDRLVAVEKLVRGDL